MERIAGRCPVTTLCTFESLQRLRLGAEACHRRPPVRQQRTHAEYPHADVHICT
jgi:hypothetical protein